MRNTTGSYYLNVNGTDVPTESSPVPPPAEDIDIIDGLQYESAAVVEKKDKDIFESAKIIGRQFVEADMKSFYWRTIEKICMLEKAGRNNAMRIMDYAKYLNGTDIGLIVSRCVYFARKFSDAQINKLIECAFLFENGKLNEDIVCFWFQNGLDHLLEIDELTAQSINMQLIKYRNEGNTDKAVTLFYAAGTIARYGLDTYFQIMRSTLLDVQSDEIAFSHHFKYIEKYGLESYLWLIKVNKILYSVDNSFKDIITDEILEIQHGMDYYRRAGTEFIKLLPEIARKFKNESLRETEKDIRNFFQYKVNISYYKIPLILERVLAYELYGEAIAEKIYSALIKTVESFCNEIDYDLQKTILKFITSGIKIFESFGLDAISKAAKIFGEYYFVDSKFGSDFLDNIIKLYSVIEVHRISDFVEKAFDVWIANKDKGKKFPEPDSAEFTEFVNYNKVGVNFDAIRPSLEKYIKIVTGRPVEIKIGPSPSSDKKTIYMPPVMCEFNNQNDNFKCYKIQVSHEAAHITYGSYDFSAAEITEKIFGEKQDMALIPAAYKNDLSFFYDRYREPQLISALFNIFEDARIEHALKRNYPALGLEISFMNQKKEANMAPINTYPNPKNLIVAAAERILLFESACATDLSGNISALLTYIADASCVLYKMDATIITSAAIADEIYALIDSLFKDKYESSIPYSNEIILRHECNKTLSGYLNKVCREEEPQSVYGVNSSEKTPTIIEKKNKGGKSHQDNKFTASAYLNNNLVSIVKKLFSGIKPCRAKRLNKMKQGGEIDIDSFVENAVELKRCGSWNENLYTEIKITHRDVAVLFLIDLSGSVCGEILTAEKTALLASCEALELIGDKFAVIGYHSEGKCDGEDELTNRFEIIKDFTDKYDGGVKMAISELKGDGGTPSAAALEYAASILSAIDARKRMIIHLTDGMPDGQVISEDGVQEVRKIVKQAGSLGIKTFCLTINDKMYWHMDQMYSAGCWVLINDIQKLPEKMAQLYKRLAF